MTTMTPQTAANRAKVGRTTIMRSLSDASLRGVRDNGGRWRIAEEALSDWLSMRPDRPPVADDRQSPSMPVVTSDAIALAASRAEADGLRAQLVRADAEVARLAAMLDRALMPRPGIIERIRTALR